MEADEVELTRLDRQAALIGPPSQLLLKAAGIGPGQRVLDLGTGLGHVARDWQGNWSDLPGRSSESIARRRPSGGGAAVVLAEAGEHHVSFVEGDVLQLAQRPGRSTRLSAGSVLFHLPDPVATSSPPCPVNLAANGLFVALDFDIGAVRTEPPVGLVAEAGGDWINRAFRAAGASPTIGARLGPILQQAGLDQVATFGIQAYLPPGDPAAAALLTGVVRSLAHEIIARGIASMVEQLGLGHSRAAPCRTPNSVELRPCFCLLRRW